MEEFDSLFVFTRLRDHLRLFSASTSAAAASCAGGEEAADECRNDAAALPLKMAAIASILIAGMAGVAIPLVGRRRRLVRADGGIFVSAKAFAAGVILATGFVHMLHGADSALSDPCLPESPWRQFPFPGFVAMLAALGTLLVDILATQFYERKHRRNNTKKTAAAVDDVPDGIAVIAVAPEPDDSAAEGKEFGGAHVHGGSDCEEGGGVASHVRHVVVSQILELGIVSHSVIIGLSLGVSQSPCTIRPLIAALSFHQLFEGFALGGCIAQAQFKNVPAALMAAFFAVTTPAGIAAGAAAASFYNADSPRALVVEGLPDSASAGILIYMALVDLIAADFLKQQQQMSSNGRLRAASYLALFLGALAMSSLAVWA